MVRKKGEEDVRLVGRIREPDTVSRKPQGEGLRI